MYKRQVIYNQLGEYIDVVVEPERRDTFPAIALAASYLKYEKSGADEEVVVVMPCDPFTEAGYFKVIEQMVHALSLIHIFITTKTSWKPVLLPNLNIIHYVTNTTPLKK